MIAIPNMDKPKNCRTCKFKSNKEGECWFVHYDSNCPLIEIVTCGECKHMRKYALRSDEPTGIWCHRWSVPRLVTDDDFCSYGERRAE